MGASNFAFGNTNNTYAVLMNREEKFSKCNECDSKHFEWEGEYVEKGTSCECGSEDVEHNTEYRAVESWEIDDFKSYLLESALEEIKDTEIDFTDEEDKSNNERNYTSYNQFSYSLSKSYGDIEVELVLTCQLVSGYYEGASLDYELEISEVGQVETFEDVEDYVEELFDTKYDQHDYSDMNKGLRTILSRKAKVWAEQQVEYLRDTMEQVFSKVSEETLIRLGSFSNGTSVYKRVS